MNNSDGLLTDEAKIAKLKDLLPLHDRSGRFFIPDDTFYTPPIDDAGLKSLSKQLAAWIGFKPTNLTISFSKDIASNMLFEVTPDGPSLKVNSRFALNPFAAPLLVAEGLLEYYLSYRKKIVLNDPKQQETLIMLGVIYSGLGLVALNYSQSYLQMHYPKLHFVLHHSKPASISTARYLNFTGRFAQEYGLELGSFAKYLGPWVQVLLPTKWQNTSSQVTYVKKAQDRVNRSMVALIASVLVVASGAILSWYVLSQRPNQLPLSLRLAKEEIDILKNAHGLCIDSIVAKERQYDRDDFFIHQRLEADRLRCQSLRNSYNYRVDQFNSQLSHH